MTDSCHHFHLLSQQVGDGLEIYVVLAGGRTIQGLEGVKGIQELEPVKAGREAGERVFVIRRDLKKD